MILDILLTLSSIKIFLKLFSLSEIMQKTLNLSTHDNPCCAMKHYGALWDLLFMSFWVRKRMPVLTKMKNVYFCSLEILVSLMICKFCCRICSF